MTYNSQGQDNSIWTPSVGLGDPGAATLLFDSIDSTTVLPSSRNNPKNRTVPTAAFVGTVTFSESISTSALALGAHVQPEIRVSAELMKSLDDI